MKVLFNTPKEKAIKKLNKIDLVCADLDECLFPFFTQALVTMEILFESLFKAHQRKYIPRLLCGGLFILAMLIVTCGNLKRLKHEILMKAFERAARGIPIDLIHKHAEYIHTFFYAESLQFLKHFAERGVPIVIVSLTIQPILDVLCSHIDFMTEGIGNNVTIDQESQTFVAYTEPIMRNGSDKLARFHDIIKRYKAHTPIVIGHSPDEIPMTEYARKMGGLSIGINPHRKLRSKFDILLLSTSWQPLVELVQRKSS